MEFLFKTRVYCVGGNGDFEIYELPDGKYFCKMSSWNEYQNSGPGDAVIWKVRGKWKSEKYYRIVEELGSEVDLFKR